MTYDEVLLVIAVLVGFTLGTWYSRHRTGGILDLRRQRNAARLAADRALESSAQAHRAASRAIRELAIDTGQRERPAVPPPGSLHVLRGGRG
jgi:hypothetical protein